MESPRWTPEDEAAVDAALRDSSRALRERLLIREAERRERAEREARRRARLRRLSFGLLGRE
jgi:hypothetical protein